MVTNSNVKEYTPSLEWLFPIHIVAFEQKSTLIHDIHCLHIAGKILPRL